MTETLDEWIEAMGLPDPATWWVDEWGYCEGSHWFVDYDEVDLDGRPSEETE